MKKINLLIGVITSTVVFVISCGDGIIGSNEDQEIGHVEWSLGTLDDPTGYVVTNSMLKATGIIKNIYQLLYIFFSLPSIVEMG